MKKFTNMLKCVGWLLLGISFIIISIGVMFDIYFVLPAATCLTLATLSMLISMIIEEFV